MLARRVCAALFFLALLVSVSGLVHAQNADAPKAGGKETGYAVKKPVFGGACKICPWGAIAEVVKAAMQSYGYDVQICYNCAGGPTEARLVAGAKVPPPLNPNAGGLAASLTPPPPNGPIDFGATGSQYVYWAYQGSHDFAQDPEGPRKQLRMIANIQEPRYYIVAVKADSGITDLHQIVEKHMPVQILASTAGLDETSPAVLAYYGLTKETVESFGGKLHPSMAEAKGNVDVIMGWGSLDDTPEYNMWYQASQKYDLKYLTLPDDLRAKLVKDEDLDDKTLPLGILRGLDEPIPALTRTGTVIYGRTDMPDDFAYTLAKALDEHQELFQWANAGIAFSYNRHNVWKNFDMPLHPGAARYYKEKGYMK